MPVLGQRKSGIIGASNITSDPMYPLAKQFTEVAKDILNESGADIFSNIQATLNMSQSREALKEFYVNESMPVLEGQDVDMDEMDTHIQEMEALFENNRQAILENAVAGSYSPVVGMTFPMHKNLLMNTVFDKAIPKTVTVSPIWTMTMETRILQTPDGEEIDIWKQQNRIYEAMESTAPFKQVAIKVPEFESVDILRDVFKATARHDALGIDTHIDGIAIETYVEAGATVLDPTTFEESVADAAGVALTWFPVNLKFAPSYGEYDRSFTEKVVLPISDGTETSELSIVVSAYMKESKFGIFTAPEGAVKAVRMAARIDTSSAMLKTCSVRWKSTTTSEEMPNANPINVTMSPEEVKDVAALYNVNQATKIMSLIQTVLGNYRDDKIHSYLDKSFVRLPDEARVSSAFDFAPRQGYYNTHIDWRERTFMDYLDTVATSLLQVLNDPNMTISVVGRSDIIRKITPTTSYTTTQTPTNVGPITLDYVKTVVTTENRVYQFISSDKMRGNDNLIILLKPRNTNRILYQVVDYQFYLSNEIRNAENYALPAIHSFDRFKIMDYQPVQGRIKIVNPTGLTESVINDDPIGVNKMNDAMGLNAPFIEPVTP